MIRLPVADHQYLKGRGDLLSIMPTICLVLEAILILLLHDFHMYYNRVRQEIFLISSLMGYHIKTFKLLRIHLAVNKLSP